MEERLQGRLARWTRKSALLERPQAWTRNMLAPLEALKRVRVTMMENQQVMMTICSWTTQPDRSSIHYPRMVDVARGPDQPNSVRSAELKRFHAVTYSRG